jgi:hypothetical protein
MPACLRAKKGVGTADSLSHGSNLPTGGQHNGKGPLEAGRLQSCGPALGSTHDASWPRNGAGDDHRATLLQGPVAQQEGAGGLNGRAVGAVQGRGSTTLPAAKRCLPIARLARAPLRWALSALKSNRLTMCALGARCLPNLMRPRAPGARITSPPQRPHRPPHSGHTLTRPRSALTPFAASNHKRPNHEMRLLIHEKGVLFHESGVLFHGSIGRIHCIHPKINVTLVLGRRAFFSGSYPFRFADMSPFFEFRACSKHFGACPIYSLCKLHNYLCNILSNGITFCCSVIWEFQQSDHAGMSLVEFAQPRRGNATMDLNASARPARYLAGSALISRARTAASGPCAG